MSFFDKFGQSDPKSLEYQNQHRSKNLRETLRQQIEEKERKKDFEYKDKERYEL